MRALCLLLLIGCTPQYHVQLPPLAPTITPDARVAMFWKMQPRTEGFTTIDGTLANDTITLADKTEVVSPEDLEPLVRADSETMRYARESVRARKKSHFFFKVSLPLLAIGSVVFGVTDGNVSRIGLGVALGSLIPYFIHRHYNHEELQLRHQAFTAYPADLGLRLNVCAHGNEVIPCEAPLPQATLPQATLPQPTLVPVN